MTLRYIHGGPGSPRHDPPKPLSIAFVGHRAMPSNYGGVEIYAEAIGQRLAKNGHRVMSFAAAPVSARRSDHELRSTSGSRHEGIELHTTYRVNGKHIGALSQALLATLSACRHKPDVVHFMAIGPAVFAPLVRLLSRKSLIVVTVAGRDDQRKKWGWFARKLLKVAMAVSMRVPDQIIAVSEALAKELRTTTKRPVTAIANGVHIPERQTPGAKLPVDPGRRFILYAGRLVPEKRADDLLRAFAQIDDDVDLVLAGGAVGSVPYQTTLHELGAADPRVKFIGHRTVDEVDLLMRSADAFVLPSELEGMPIALLEAMGRGVPVVVSDLPCHLEVIGSESAGARIVGVGDVAALSAAMLDVLQDQAAARTDACKLAKGIRATHRWEAVADAVEQVYLRPQLDAPLLSVVE